MLEKKFYLKRNKDRVVLWSEFDESLRFPLNVDQLFYELTKRRIPYDRQKVDEYFHGPKTEEIDLGAVPDGLNTKPLLRIATSPDKMKAYLLVLPFHCGTTLEIKDIENAIYENNVKFNINRNLFPQIIENQGEAMEYLIAEGVFAKNGEDARLTYYFNTEVINMKPQELEDGSVDFYNLNLIQSVHAGSPLVEKIAATSGIEGRNVYGEANIPVPGKDIRMSSGQNTQVIENNTRLVATKSGHVVQINGKVNVLPIYEVKEDVDFTTGNIKFPGNVVVRGNVKANFAVEAEGDVEVFGNLEGLVKSDANIIVKKGVVRGRAVAKGYIGARYVENAVLESGSNILAADAIMHSTVKANKKITVGGRKGVIVGGICCAGEEITAKNIGSTLGTATILEVGINPELRQEYKDIIKKQQILAENLEKAAKIVKTLQEMKEKLGVLPTEKNELHVKFSRLLTQVRLELEDLSFRKYDLEVIFQGMEKARVSVEKTIYSGVGIAMGKATHTVMEEISRATFYLEDYEIKTGPYQGKGKGGI